MWSLSVAGRTGTDPSQDDLDLSRAVVGADDPDPEATLAKIMAAKDRVDSAQAASAETETKLTDAVKQALDAVLADPRFGAYAWVLSTDHAGVTSQWPLGGP